jgi:hypothetical protein
LGGVSTPGSLFRHTVYKSYLNLTVFVFIITFVSKNSFFTSQKRTFLFFGSISTLSGAFLKNIQDFSEYGVFVFK